jgi:POT family proton-dependent oligopeptide transporter
MLMGAWYIAKFLGSLLAGVMGAYWGAIPATAFFGIGAISVLAASAILLAMSRRERAHPAGRS